MTTPRIRSRLAASLVLFALLSVAVVAPSVARGPDGATPQPTSDELGKRMLALGESLSRGARTPDAAHQRTPDSGSAASLGSDGA